MTKVKTNKIILVILVLGIAMALVFILTMKPDEPAKPVIDNKSQTKQEPQSIINGWKVYQNEEFGFRVDYPENWKIKENSNQCLELTSPQTLKLIEEQKTLFDGENYGPWGADVTIYYYSSAEEEYVNKANELGAATIDELIEKDDSIEKIGEIKIDDQNAIEVTEHGEGTYYSIFVENNGHLYKIFFSNIDLKGGLSETEKQILLTIRFL